MRVSILDSILDSWFLCELRTNYWETSQGLSLVKAVPVCWVGTQPNGISRIKMQQSRNRVSILDSILDSRGDQESSVSLLLRGTVIIFDFYSLNQTFALTTFKHFDLLKCKFIPNEGRSCHWEWYPKNV